MTALAHQLGFLAPQSLARSFSVLPSLTHFHHIIWLCSIHDGEGHAGILIHECDHGFIHAAPRHQLPEPTTEVIGFLAHLPDHGGFSFFSGFSHALGFMLWFVAEPAADVDIHHGFRGNQRRHGFLELLGDSRTWSEITSDSSPIRRIRSTATNSRANSIV